MIDEQTFDTSDETQVKDARKRAVLAQKQADLDLLEIMHSEIGRRVIWDLIGLHGAYLSSYSNDPIAMAFNEGSRNFAVRVTERLIRVCPDCYLKAQTEAINRMAMQNGKVKNA